MGDQDQDTLYRILKHGYCTGSACHGKGIAEDDHACPYTEEVYGDSESLCNCCDICQHECFMNT